jgi:hypothetical protein
MVEASDYGSYISLVEADSVHKRPFKI